MSTLLLYCWQLVTKVNNQFICLFSHPFEKYLVPVIYPKLQWALSTEVVKADLIPVFVQLMMEGTTITVYAVICCMMSYILSAVITKCFTDSKRWSGVKRILTCFAYWNHREHLHSNISGLLGLEILNEVNSASQSSFQGSLHASPPCVHHPDIVHFSNSFWKTKCSLS